MVRKRTPLKVTIALGGHAILKRGEKGTAEEQLTSAKDTARLLVRMIERGDRIVITHGNGPQVGDILLRNERAKDILPPMPLDICGAESQGMIGYLLQQALEEALRAKRLRIPVATILTRTLVDESDPAFGDPTKPIGPSYTAREASELRRRRRWRLIKDNGRGYRRVVPSPLPLDILEKKTIARLFTRGTLVIAAGGGGIPVVRERDGRLRGVEAVLDKDRTAALLASILRTDVLLILTDVDRVYLNYDRPDRRPLKQVDVEACKEYLTEGQFPAGSMGPKIESAIAFLGSGGSRVVIASPEQAEEALAGRAGTTITV